MKYFEGYLLDNRYKLERFIGSGTFGEVWVAIDTATDIEVAIKVYVSMDEKGLMEFKKEFQISFELNHTNLLHANYLGVNSEDKRPYLVMPFCPDGSVTRFAGEMSEQELWSFIRDVSAGLAYLHSKNPPIIHQDIKPDNILILKSGDYVISDFGISKQLRATLRKSAASLNSAGAISYMGPERFSKKYNAVKASDIWSLGVSIFELATNELPFCGMGGSLLKQGADMPELPEEFSPTLNMVCQACMAKETWNRPTAQQLYDFTVRFMNTGVSEPTWNVSSDKQEPAPAASAASAASAAPAAAPAIPATPVAPQPEVVPTEAPSAPKPEVPEVSQKGNVQQTIMAASETPVFAQYHEDVHKSKATTAFNPLAWVVVALAGLLVGFVLNYFI